MGAFITGTDGDYLRSRGQMLGLLMARGAGAEPFHLAVLGLLLARGAGAELFNLDDSVPFATSNGARVRWGAGWDALVVADSSCVRVNARGVFAKPSHWTPRDLGRLGWAAAGCVPAGSEGLCVAAGGVAFPVLRAPRYDPGSDWAGLGCGRGADGRVLDPAAGAYDVSACDVLDAGGDAVLCGRTLWTRRTGLSAGVYWTLCLLCVLVVRALSYLVVRGLQRVEGEDDQGRADRITVAGCLLILPLCLFPDGDAGFVTVEERLFFVFLCCYAGVYSVLFLLSGQRRDPPIYNLIAASLQIVASRLYLGVETPYNPVLIWGVMTRAMVKLRGPGFEAVSCTTVLLDSLLLSLMCVLGFPYNPCYLVAVAAVALATADAFERA